MKVVIGLGNPGKKYENNRHNVGHLVADLLASKKPVNVKVVETDCYMNSSGTFVKKLVDKHKLDLSNLYIVFDDLDIKLGEYKIQFGKGPKDHNGLLDIYDKLGTRDFWHVRVGVDNRGVDNKVPGEEYVLQDFSGEEKEKIIQMNKKLINDLVKQFV